MDSRSSWWCWSFLTSAALLTPTGAAPAQLGEKILAAGGEAAKERLIMRQRGQMSGKDALLLVRKEANPRLAALVLGTYFEDQAKGKARGAAVVPEEAAAVLRAAGQRPELAGRAALMVATSNHLRPVVDALLAGKNPEPADRRAAAEVLATRGKVFDLLGTAAPHGRDQTLTAWDEKTAARLLADTDPEVVELATLASAYLRLPGVRARVGALADTSPPGILAAKLLYHAQMKMTVPPALIARAFATPPAAVEEVTRLSPALSTYSVRVPSWCYACAALGKLGQTQHLKHLYQALAHEDLRVQMDAVRAIEEVGAAEAVPQLLARLEASPWPVKVVLLSALGTIPSAESVMPLIRLLEQEKGRLRLDLLYALASIAGAQQGPTAEYWVNWWYKNKDTYKPDRARTQKFRRQVKFQDMDVSFFAGEGSFYDLTLFSNRVVFVPDASNSMRGAKIASLKAELSKTLKALKPHEQFNVITFGGVVDVMQPGRLIPQEQVPAALEKVANLTLTSGTRTYDGLETAMLLPDVDTLVLLTDGKPVGGQFDEWDRIIAAVAVFNRYRPIAIHTLEFVERAVEKKHKTAELKDLATRNAGWSGSPHVGK